MRTVYNCIYTYIYIYISVNSSTYIDIYACANTYIVLAAGDPGDEWHETLPLEGLARERHARARPLNVPRRWKCSRLDLPYGAGQGAQPPGNSKCLLRRSGLAAPDERQPAAPPLLPLPLEYLPRRRLGHCLHAAPPEAPDATGNEPAAGNLSFGGPEV